MKLCYLVNTLIPGDFEKFIKKAMQMKESYFINKKSLKVNAIPEFVNLFKNANFISCK